MAIVDEIMNDLPADRGSAVLMIADRVSAFDFDFLSEEEIIIVRVLLTRFIKKYNIALDVDNLSPNKLTSITEREAVGNILKRIYSARAKLIADVVESKISDLLNSYEHSTGEETFGFAHLNEDEKRKLHLNISRIRAIISDSEISDKKKNALYEKLNALSKEVDMLGTQTDRFFSFMGDVGFVLGDMATKAKPLFTEVKEMIKAISRARARQEGVSLPPGDTPLMLTASSEVPEGKEE